MSVTVAALRVLSVADDPLVRGGLVALQADRPDCLVAGQIAANTDVAEGLEVSRREW